MAKNIDADKLIAEIERLKCELPHGASASQVVMETACKEEAYDEVLQFINSLPEDKPSEDLEEEIIDWAGKFNPAIREEIQSTAYHFAGWQKEQMMKDAVDADVNYYECTFGSYVEFAVDVPKPSKYSDKEKVKIIIVKEDKQ